MFQRSVDTVCVRKDCISADKAPVGCLASLPECCLERAIQRNPALAMRLQELGLRPGTSVKLGQKVAGGGRIVTIGTARYAIDRDTLRQLDVQL
ncbi:FeoA domain protein [Corynebacterium kalinowskii]|uniref:FeoA domain protein n=1 Tax=Corynebacterium kalinowskii TaxID=2675216 RepID=A0A6B8VBU8_9CORY|nr:FeoA family protein [Corynebacterium kalinowskii]QGU02642.1 FeoA domain protein [Corynebacterium kalinowskii]